jgi:hypothetical protein
VSVLVELHGVTANVETWALTLTIAAVVPLADFLARTARATTVRVSKGSAQVVDLAGTILVLLVSSTVRRIANVMTRK